MPREFIVFNGMGQSIESPTADEMRSVLAALDDHDTEHGAAWIESDDGHVIEYSVGGTIAFGEADGIRRRYQGGASREKALELWLLLVDGRLDLIEREPWQTDEPPRPKGPTAEELGAIYVREDRAFYDSLGPERADERCREPDCTRGPVRWSVFCRPHTFAEMKKRPSPFHD